MRKLGQELFCYMSSLCVGVSRAVFTMLKTSVLAPLREKAVSLTAFPQFFL